ncbi:MAG: OB-fold nucleic acid binding domain-containing protein [Bacteroidales bacterium]|nr:OB-fold nucleic acid binding domain-containing protein [Bacteroidales bacterium]
MKIFKHTLWILAVVLFASCDLTPDIAPVPHSDLKANTTIAELLAMHEIGSLDSYIHIPDSSDIIITGIVTTSDEHGNCYKYINIEDGTGGIQIKINNTALYNKFKVGQRVYVTCGGLDLGDYRKLPQMGIWANDAMQAIPSGKISNYVFCDGVPQPFEPQIVLTSIPNANAIPDGWYNRLVRLEACHFVEGGMATYCDPNAATSHDIEMADGTTITMRTSNYADFINEMLPSGNGTVVGILTRYNNTVQIVIRDLDDVQDFVIPQQTQTIFSVNYPTAFEDGWIHGADWSIINNSSFTGFYYNGSTTVSESWLISPVIDLSNVSDPMLEFAHRAPQGFNSANMKCFYTPVYTGDVNTTLWIPLPLSAASGTNTFVTESFDLPEGAQSENFRIAFKAMEALGENVQWAINNITITGLAK